MPKHVVKAAKIVSQDETMSFVKSLLVDTKLDHMIGSLKMNQQLSAIEIVRLRQKSQKENLLHVLVAHGDLEGVRVLIEVVKVDPNLLMLSYTSLMVAAETGQFSVFKYLVENGAKLNLVDKEGLQALSFAVIHNRIHIVEYLIDGLKNKSLQFDVNAFGKNNNMTALMYACRKGFSQIVKKLLECDQIKVDQLDKSHGSALHLCANRSDEMTVDQVKDIVGALLKKNADMCLKDDKGATPLMIFSNRRCVIALKTWKIYHQLKYKDDSLKVMLDLVNQKDNSGQFPLYCAAIAGRIENLEFLLSLGADINTRTPKGNTVAMIAAYHGHFELAHKLVKGINVINAFSGEKSILANDVNIANDEGWTLLSMLLRMAIQYKNLQDVKSYRELAKKRRQGKELLIDIIKLTNDLESATIEFNVKKHKYNLTPLALSVQLGELDITELLLSRGASLRTLVRHDTSVFRFSAYTKNKQNIFQRMLEHKLQLICQLANQNREAETKEIMETVIDSNELPISKDRTFTLSEQMIQAIKFFVEYLCDESEFILRVDTQDNLVLTFNSNTFLILNEQDIYPIIQIITKTISAGEDLSTSQMTQILKDNVKSFKERELQKLISLKSNGCMDFIQKLYRYCNAFSLDDLKLSLLLSSDSESINDEAIVKLFDAALSQIKKIIENQKNFLNTVHDKRSLLRTHVAKGDIAGLDEMAGKLQAELHLFEGAMKEFSSLKKLITDLSTASDVVESSLEVVKKKTKGRSASEVIQQKMAEYLQKRQLNPEHDVYRTVIVSAKERSIALLMDAIKEVEEITLKSDAELRELKPWHDIQQNIGAEIISADEENVLFIHRNFLELMSGHSSRNLSHKHERTFEDNFAISGVLAVLDHMKQLKDILNFQPLKSLELTPEDITFLTERSCWGGFSLLTEALKKHKGSHVFSSELAHILRNLCFHEDGKVKSLATLSELKDLCQKLLEHLGSIKTSKKQIKTSDLQSFLKKIDSKLLNELIRLALEQVANPCEPSLDCCVTQIHQAEDDFLRFKNICQRNPFLMDNPLTQNVIHVGLGLTVARLSTYTSAMKRLYHADYRRLGLSKYKKYIEIGNRFRHNDEEAFEPWRTSIDNLVHELMSDYVENGVVTSSLVTDLRDSDRDPLSLTSPATELAISSQMSLVPSAFLPRFNASTMQVSHVPTHHLKRFVLDPKAKPFNPVNPDTTVLVFDTGNFPLDASAVGNLYLDVDRNLDATVVDFDLSSFAGCGIPLEEEQDFDCGFRRPVLVNAHCTPLQSAHRLRFVEDSDFYSVQSPPTGAGPGPNMAEDNESVLLFNIMRNSVGKVETDGKETEKKLSIEEKKAVKQY